MKSQIHLIRHGVTEGNEKHWYYGSSDIPLSNEGVDALTALAAAGIYPPADETESRAAADLYTSGLLRAEQTFFLIYGQKERRVLPEFQEMRFGDYEKKTHEDLAAELDYQTWIGDQTGELSPPGGESPLQFQERIRRGYRLLLNNHRQKELSPRRRGREVHSIVVCHGGVISVIMRNCFDAGQKDFFLWIPDPGHGYTITLREGEAVSYEGF